jgi:hypothetical protein
VQQQQHLSAAAAAGGLEGHMACFYSCCCWPSCEGWDPRQCLGVLHFYCQQQQYQPPPLLLLLLLQQTSAWLMYYGQL